MTNAENVERSCRNCKLGVPIEHWNYSKVSTGAEWKTKLDGIACLIFTKPYMAQEPFIVWKTGSDDGLCECWTERKKP